LCGGCRRCTEAEPAAVLGRTTTVTLETPARPSAASPSVAASLGPSAPPTPQLPSGPPIAGGPQYFVGPQRFRMPVQQMMMLHPGGPACPMDPRELSMM